MKIQFRNIGAIKKMAFELKPGLTLLCGPNNTGKTWTAYAIFSILHGLKHNGLNWITEAEINQLKTTGMIEIDFTLLTQSQPFLSQVSRTLGEQLADAFDAPAALFDENCIQVGNLYHGIKEDDECHSTWRMGDYIFKASITGSVQSKKLAISLIKQEKNNNDSQIDTVFLLETFNQLISQMVADSYVSRPYVLTAERSAISLFSKELSASRSGFLPSPVPYKTTFGPQRRTAMGGARAAIGAKAARSTSYEAQEPTAMDRFDDWLAPIRYSLPIRVSLGIAEDLANIAKNPDPKSKYGGYARTLEQEILGGEIEVGEYGELTYFPSATASATAAKLRIHLTASMIKSLASLVIYLRYQAHPGDLLIIDEPELNLHPVNQRKIARFLCKLINAGLDVIVSTHSDYIIREINNAIILSDPKMEEVRKRYHYVPRDLLTPDLVTVLMFDADGEPKQEAVTELGFSVESIDEELNLLNQISDDIMWKLEKSQGE